MSYSQNSSPNRHPTIPTFASPPLDGTLTLPDIYEWHSRNSPKHPLFVYEDGPGKVRTILWEESIHGLNRAALRCTDAVGLQKLNARNKFPVVAILASLGSWLFNAYIGDLPLTPPSDTISFTFLILGIMRAGGICFPISPRNSPAAVAHLLAKTDCHDVFVSPDRAMQDLISASKSLIPEPFDLAVHATPIFDELFPSGVEGSKEVTFKAPKRAPNELGGIYHSSGRASCLAYQSLSEFAFQGSTAFPKPIFFKNSAFVQFAASICAFFPSRFKYKPHVFRQCSVKSISVARSLLYTLYRCRMVWASSR